MLYVYLGKKFNIGKLLNYLWVAFKFMSLSYVLFIFCRTRHKKIILYTKIPHIEWESSTIWWWGANLAVSPYIIKSRQGSPVDSYPHAGKGAKDTVQSEYTHTIPLIPDPPPTSSTALSDKKENKKKRDLWHLTWDTRHGTPDKGHVTHDIWHVKNDTQRLVNIVSIF